jgi:hypothetical protein
VNGRKYFRREISGMIGLAAPKGGRSMGASGFDRATDPPDDKTHAKDWEEDA